MLEMALASQSPRRRELLESAGFSVHVFPVKLSEIIDENLNPMEIASQLAIGKGQAAVEQHNPLKQKGFLILSGDTVVAVEGRVLGKPADISQAHDYLRLLSAKTHSVISAIHLQESGVSKVWTGFAETKVQFKTLSAAEIESYVATGEPMDKAGAYAIQGGGGKFVSSFVGSWSNVVGLPLELMQSALKENSWNVRRRTP